MRPVIPSLAFLLFALAPACTDTESQVPECRESCDGAAPAHTALVNCWLEESETDDDFFRLDKLHCSYDPESAALDVARVSMDVVMANGKRTSMLFDADNARTDTLVAGIQSDGFPLELGIQATLTFTDRNDEIIGIDALRLTRQTIVVQGLADATLETPLQILLPFDVMELGLFNRHIGEARIEFGHDVVIGEDAIAIGKMHQIIDFGRSNLVRVAVTQGAESLGATTILLENTFGSPELGRHESTFRGSGRYEISLDATRSIEDVELIEPEGQQVALCRLMTSSSAPMLALHCAGNLAPGVEETRHVRIVPAAAEGESAEVIEVDFLASGEVTIPLRDDQLPAQVEVHSILEDSVSGLRSLDSETHVARQLVSMEEEVFSANLPFVLWTIELEASDDLLFARFKPDERFLELGYQWNHQFALHIRDDESLTVQPTAPASLVIAVPVDVDSISGILEIVDQQGGTTKNPAEIADGRWLVSADGLSTQDSFLAWNSN